MIEKSLNQLFSVIAEEAGRNRAFAGSLEQAVLKMAEELGKSREIDQQVQEFNPFLAYKEGGAEAIEAALKNRSQAVLKQMVQRHNADPAGALGARPRKPDLIAALVELAEKRARRDARLFEY